MDPFGSPAFQQQLAEELERIGAGASLRAGLVVNAPITPEMVLAAFRATPNAAGSEAFLAALRRILGKGGEDAAP